MYIYRFNVKELDKKKSYLLVDPIYNDGNVPPNIHLGQIEFQLIKYDCPVKLIDFVTSAPINEWTHFESKEQEFFSRIINDSKDVDIVYISSGFGNALKPYPFFPRVLKIAKLLKDFKPAIFIVVGGALVNYYETIYGVSVKSFSKGTIDYVLVGNELSFVSLFVDKSAIFNNDLGACRWYNWEKEKYPEFRSVMYHIGCPYKCDFCFEGKIFNKYNCIETKEAFIKTIRDSVEIDNIHNFVFEDSTFISYVDFIELVEKVEELAISFSVYARVSEVLKYPERVKLLKRAGCRAFIIGFETLDDIILEQQHKGINSSNNTYVINYLKDIGIEIQGCFMLGFPQDSIDNMCRTLDFAIKQDLNGYRWHIFQPNFNNLNQSFYSHSVIRIEDHLSCQINVPDSLLLDSISRNPEICLLDEHFLPRARHVLSTDDQRLKNIGYHGGFNYADVLKILQSLPNDMILNEEKLYHELFK